MGQLIKLLLIAFILFFSIPACNSAIQGGINYSIPIDYSKLDKSELELKAEKYYNSALQSKSLDDNMTSALNLYTILTKIAPNNSEYALRLGKLYDVIGQDNQAKGQYYRAMSLNQADPKPYYYLGNYFYDREQFRQALKFYKRAYDNGYSDNPETISQINNICKKFGDSKNIVEAVQPKVILEAIEENIIEEFDEEQTYEPINELIRVPLDLPQYDYTDDIEPLGEIEDL